MAGIGRHRAAVSLASEVNQANRLLALSPLRVDDHEARRRGSVELQEAVPVGVDSVKEDVDKKDSVDDADLSDRVAGEGVTIQYAHPGVLRGTLDHVQKQIARAACGADIREHSRANRWLLDCVEGVLAVVVRCVVEAGERLDPERIDREIDRFQSSLAPAHH